MDFSSSTQTVAWFRDRYREGTLVLKPPYQRKPVWAARQKCYLVESILLRLPVPEIYIQQSTKASGESQYAIVDGQQRVRAVLQFLGADADPGSEEDNKFPLDKLEPESPWRNATFEDLPDDAKSVFYGYMFAVRNLNTQNDDEVRDMFRRLNKYLAPLKAQELRNATYVGPFARLAYSLAENEYWAENRIVTAASIRRMGDVEFMSDLIVGLLHGPQGGSPRVLDEYYRQYEDYEDEFPDEKRVRRLFDETLRAIQTLLPDVKDHRWSNRADFYSLFVALGMLLSENPAPAASPELRETVLSFGKRVDRRLADESAPGDPNVIAYVRAVEKGVNDKRRRADRHQALLTLLVPLIAATG